MVFDRVVVDSEILEISRSWIRKAAKSTLHRGVSSAHNLTNRRHLASHPGGIMLSKRFVPFVPFLLLLAAFLATSTALAQSISTLQGTVTDTKGAAA